jgi:hypothetical protein
MELNDGIFRNIFDGKVPDEKLNFYDCIYVSMLRLLLCLTKKQWLRNLFAELGISCRITYGCFVR